MISALIEIHQALLKVGYSETTADELVARLMEEEALEYATLVDSLKKASDKFSIN